MNLFSGLRFSGCLTVAAALLLTACNAPEEKMAHVTTASASHYVVFPLKKIMPLPSESQRLNAFVQSIPAAAVSYVGIEADDANVIAFKRAKWIKTYLVRRGIDAHTIHLQPVMGAYGTLQLTIEYSVAVPPEHCPDWSKNAVANYDNTRFSNFGCAYYNNLAQQLSDPADLNGASGAPQTSSTRESVTLQKYYLGVAPSTSSGVSSSGGSSGSSGSSQ